MIVVICVGCVSVVVVIYVGANCVCIVVDGFSHAVVDCGIGGAVVDGGCIVTLFLRLLFLLLGEDISGFQNNERQ